MAKKRLAIVGNGMASSRLVDELLQRGAGARYTIDVYGDEPGASYNRIMLSKVLAGGDPDHIRLRQADWSPPAGAEVRFVDRTTIEKLDAAARKLITNDGRTFDYDIAVLATGSKPFVPKFVGLNLPSGAPKPGVFAYRTLDDCLQIRSKCRAGDNAVVLGGGLLGLECAKALRDAGLHVTVVHLAPTLMETQLDAAAGRMLQRQVEQQGLFVRCGVTLSEVVGTDQVEAVKLSDGSLLAADLVVLSCGIRPRVELAGASGIPVNRGIVVNDCLATSVPGVYAVGECAEHRGRVYGIVPPIWEQCRVLAEVLTGTHAATGYTGSKLYARLKVAGVEVASMGQIEPTLETDRVVQVIEERRSAYRKLIVREGVLVGAQFVGDTEAAANVVQLFDGGDELPTNALEVLCNPATSGTAADPQICNCARVRRSQIENAIANGCDSLAAVGEQCGAGTGCGSCRSQLTVLLRKSEALKERRT